MELCLDGTLETLINNAWTSRKFFSKFFLWDFLVDACHVLAMIHAEGFVHHDIKPANILYQGNHKLMTKYIGFPAKKVNANIALETFLILY